MGAQGDGGRQSPVAIFCILGKSTRNGQMKQLEKCLADEIIKDKLASQKQQISYK